MIGNIIKLAAAAALLFTSLPAMAQWKIKMQNKMNKYLYLIALLIMTTSLASCHDDNPEITGNEDEVIEKEQLPTHDIIETTVDAKTVVCAEGLDEISALFKNRLINENIQPEITPETELVIIDEKSAIQFINDKEKYQQLEDLYTRGGLIYLHKPALQCSALVARIQLGVFNEIPDETIPPLFDVYILNINGSEYNVGDVYNGDGQEITYFDEDGNPHTETIENIEKPSEYLYGRYAENAAKFVNTILHGESSASRADAILLSKSVVIKQCDNTIRLSQTYKKKEHHMAKEVTLIATGIISIIANIECKYDPMIDTDIYNITLIESYPGRQLWLGEREIHYKGAWYDKYGGFALSALNVNASLSYPEAKVRLRSHNIEKPSEINVLSVPDYDPFNLFWNLKVKEPLKYTSHRAKNGSVNKYSKIFTTNFSIEESWKWEVPYSSKIQDPKMELTINTAFSITSGAASSGIGANHDYNICNQYNIQNTFELPLPNKYEDTILLAFYLRSGNTGVKTDVLFANSPTLKSLYHENKRSALSRKQLIHSLSKEWQKVYNELKNANLFSPGLNADVIITLRMSNFEDITIGENAFTRICVDKNGNVSME